MMDPNMIIPALLFDGNYSACENRRLYCFKNQQDQIARRGHPEIVSESSQNRFFGDPLHQILKGPIFNKKRDFFQR